MGEQNPGEVLEQLVVGVHAESDEDTVRAADIEGEDVDVVCGAPALVVSGFEYQGFTSSQIVLGK